MLGTIQALWRFPVKSMQGESLRQVDVTTRGVPGDRAYGVLDVDNARIATAKRVRPFAALMACRAGFVAPPEAGNTAPPVRIELPDGRAVRSDEARVDAVLSAYLGRAVRLVRAAPDVDTDDQYDPAASASGAATAMGAFRDAQPLSLLTSATLARLGELQPRSRFDPRRFRMNVIIQATGSGFVDGEWLGRELALGRDVRVVVRQHDSRCVMTTLAQGDLPRDPQILKTIARHNAIRQDGVRARPCAGVYAGVRAQGELALGDGVTAG